MEENRGRESKKKIGRRRASDTQRRRSVPKAVVESWILHHAKLQDPACILFIRSHHPTFSLIISSREKSLSQQITSLAFDHSFSSASVSFCWLVKWSLSLSKQYSGCTQLVRYTVETTWRQRYPIKFTSVGDIETEAQAYNVIPSKCLPWKTFQWPPSTHGEP